MSNSKMTPVRDYAEPGLDLDFKPFDAESVAVIVAATFPEKDLPELTDQTIAEMVRSLNAAAIWYRRACIADHRPSDRKLRDTLEAILRPASKLNELLPVEEETDPLTGEPCIQHVPREISGALEPYLESKGRRLLVGRWDDTDEATPRETVQDSDLDDTILPSPDPFQMLRDVPDEPEESQLPYVDPELIDRLNSAENANDFLVFLVEDLAVLTAAIEQRMTETPEVQHSERGSRDRDFATECIKIYERVFKLKAALSRSGTDGKPDGPLIRFLRACRAVLDEADNRADNARPPTDETQAGWIKAYRKAGSGSG